VSEFLRLLCVGGHPADTFDCAGGALAHHVRNGDSVTVVALTQGTRIHDVVISDTLRFRDRVPEAAELQALMTERALVKEDEVRRACAFLSITDVRFFRYDDEVLTVREDLIVRMASLIREVRPDVIITHHPQELGIYGVHHAATSQLVLEAISAAGGVGVGDPNQPHRVAQVFFTVAALQYPLNVLSAGMGWYPDLIIDITDMVEAKVRALDALRSQQYGGDYARKRTEIADGAMGVIAGVPYAEGYVTYLPEVAGLFPVSEARRRLASQSEAEWHASADRIIATKVELPD
jgi:LmbE family N-acetylglucosaminyl deacetylase